MNVYCTLSMPVHRRNLVVQLITVACFMIREVGSAAVCVVILCLCKSVLRVLSVVFLSHYVTSVCDIQL